MHPDLQVDSLFEHTTASNRDDQFGLVFYDAEGKKHRRYLIDSEEAVKTANFDFSCNRHKLSEREQSTAAYFIKQASITWRVPADPTVDRLAKEASTNNIGFMDKYTEVQKIASTPARITALHGKYPLDTSEQVMNACSYFEKHASKMPASFRREYATNTQRQATLLNVKTNSTIQKYASQTFADHLGAELRKRSKLAPAYRPMYQKLANYIGSIGVDDFSGLLKELDEKSAIHFMWGKDLKDPLDATLGIPKEASYSGWSITIDGKTYKTSDLEKACSTDEVKTMFGDDYAEQFKDTGVFDSLPTPTKRLVLQNV